LIYQELMPYLMKLLELILDSLELKEMDTFKKDFQVFGQTLMLIRMVKSQQTKDQFF
jgi:hypothetical protein